MIHAYQEIYLNKAQANLGDAFDYAINTCNIPGNDFIKLFTVSSISERIEIGEATYILGKSGIEIVIDIIQETTDKNIDIVPRERFTRSPQYWIGWAVCYYQWYSDRKFYDIFKVLSYEDLEKMYYTIHEADITKFVDIVDAKIKSYYTETNLRRLRTTYGITQAELARRSNVTLRSIQMYEQRNKNINKASAQSLYQIAKVLGCKIEDLIEKGAST